MGGSSETELKLLAVRPTSSPSAPRVVTTVTPVANEPRALAAAAWNRWRLWRPPSARLCRPRHHEAAEAFHFSWCGSVTGRMRFPKATRD
jgi:hypothetical protein